MAGFALDIVAWIYLSIQATIWLISSLAALRAVPSKKSSKCRYIIRIWFKAMYKMRSVYSAFAVHTFDVVTDLLVIAEWYNAENGKNKQVEHVDSRLMAQISIGILLFHKIMSSIAVFFVTNNSFIRAFLQFCDFLVFEEMFIGHTKIVKNLKNEQIDNNYTQNQNINSSNNSNNIQNQSKSQIVTITTPISQNGGTSATKSSVNIYY